MSLEKNKLKGIILAGGAGSRLHPITKGVSKQLLPVYDKPMIYYPLSVLMRLGIRDILIISTCHDIDNFKRLLGNGSKIGVKFTFLVQESPDGIAQAFLLGEDFIGQNNVVLILGDNIFYGNGLNDMLNRANETLNSQNKATIFGYFVNDPKRYGVVEFDNDGNAISIIEKPKKPKSKYAVVGLYFYPNDVIQITKSLKPSKRGELEITSVNDKFLEMKKLKVEIMGRGFAWFDTGTHESLLDASNYINTIEKRQGFKIGCIEEIAYEMNFITKKQFLKLAKGYKSSTYGEYLIQRYKEI